MRMIKIHKSVLVGMTALACAAASWAGQKTLGFQSAKSHNKREVSKMEKATFAAGCFWGVEQSFRQVPGVVDTQVGYTGGHTGHPTYEQVCSHTTGHAEAVEVTFDPSKITYRDLLKRFWEIHDPTQKNRQGWDIGDNYRSAIFYHTPEQKAQAADSLRDEQTRHKRPIATEIVPAATFWRAEEYHQRYDEKHGITCKLPR